MTIGRIFSLTFKEDTQTYPYKAIKMGIQEIKISLPECSPKGILACIAFKFT
jgi:hypothetical protein